MRNFKIEVTKQNEVIGFFSSNSHKEDFVRFIHKEYGVEKEAVKVFMLSEGDSIFIKNNKYFFGDRNYPESFYDLETSGKITLLKRDFSNDPLTEISEEIITIVKEIVGVEVSNWPYKEVVTTDGQKHLAFIGWQL